MNSIQSYDHRHLSVCTGFASEEEKAAILIYLLTIFFTAVIELNLIQRAH